MGPCRGSGLCLGGDKAARESPRHSEPVQFTLSQLYIQPPRCSVFSPSLFHICFLARFRLIGQIPCVCIFGLRVGHHAKIVFTRGRQMLMAQQRPDMPNRTAICRPTAYCRSPCPPGSLRLVIRLTAPRASQIRLQPLPWGGTTPPSPSPPDVSPHTTSGWGDLAVRRQRLPSASRGCPCATSLALAASCTLARV